jgi:hypothetical protein
MRILLVVAICALCWSCTSSTSCGDIEPFTERKDSTSVYIARLDSNIMAIRIRDGGFSSLKPTVVRVDAQDTIWISLSNMKKFRGSDEPRHEVSIYRSTDSTQIIIEADISHLSAFETGGSSVECSPAPEHGYIDAATVFLPMNYPAELVQ